MRFKSKFRWILFFIITAICAGCGLWIYLWARSGRLYQEGVYGFLWRMAIVAVPFIICMILSVVYNGDGGDVELHVWSICLTVFPPLIFAICVGIGFLGINVKWYYVLQIAVPIFFNYLMSLQCLICPNEPPACVHPTQTNNSTSTYKSSTDDCNSKGLPTGRAD